MNRFTRLHGISLDSGVLIAGERDARPVSGLLVTLEQEHGETEVVISSITVIELEHGLHRANTPALARQRRAYLDTIFLAIPVEPFTKEMGSLRSALAPALSNDKGEVTHQMTGIFRMLAYADFGGRSL